MNVHLCRLCVFLHVLTASVSLNAGFVAFSLNEAQHQLEARSPSDDIQSLGGITRIVGIVYDREKNDLIIVGRGDSKDDPLELDDFVVSLRAMSIHEAPWVSIDRTPTTAQDFRQEVRFGGKAEHTALGLKLLQADIILKKLGLGLLPCDVYGAKSYFDICAENWRNTGNEQEIASRFWFLPKDPAYADDEAVLIINNLSVMVETQVLTKAASPGQSQSTLTPLRDALGDLFSELLTSNFAEFAAIYPEVGRIRGLYHLVAIADGICNYMKTEADLTFWLQGYVVPSVAIDPGFKLLDRKEILQSGRGSRNLRIEGGIELKPLLREVKDGIPTALRDLVVATRPKGHALIWELPLTGWEAPSYSEDFVADSELANDSETDVEQPEVVGCSLVGSFFAPGGMAKSLDSAWNTPESSLMGVPITSTHASKVQWGVSSADVGGVMLSGSARISNPSRAAQNLCTGNFSLILSGENARIDPMTFRRFVTALWAVYYSRVDPGISIDPIEKGGEKHLVRYIGKVVNTDLGRVMRMADYVMKKWAVGTDRPDFRDFMTPDDYSWKMGTLYVGASSRFWFVPKEMTFKSSEDMILYQSGRMTVMTEFLVAGNSNVRVNPSSQRFADWFTANYEAVAAKYPIYGELMLYAKLVSLAKYLKESGVPLYWFLMANKNLVLLEESCGTVDALFKGSDHFKDVSIEGGVDLAPKGQYVYDQGAVNAIDQAMARKQSSQSGVSGPAKMQAYVPGNFSFDLNDKSFSVVPQHSAVSGIDGRGNRYQTDVAFRTQGFKLTDRCWDATRKAIIRTAFVGLWNDRVEGLQNSTINNAKYAQMMEETWGEAEAEVAETLKGVEGLKGVNYPTNGELKEGLQQAIGGSVSEPVLAAVTENALYRADLELVRFFNAKDTSPGEFGQGWKLLVPYRIRRNGEETVVQDDITAPKSMALIDVISGEEEILYFDTKKHKPSVGYFPDDPVASQVIGLFLMTDCTLRLEDRIGNQFQFDEMNRLMGMYLSEDHEFTFEYLENPIAGPGEKGVSIRPEGEEHVPLLNVMLPKKMKVTDLGSDASEVLAFDENSSGYLPENGDKSRYIIMSLMTDGSFRLTDKGRNEIAIDAAGEYKGVLPAEPMVKSIATATHKVTFSHKMGSDGHIVVADASLSELDSENRPSYVVRYTYDDSGRLCKADGESAGIARLQETNSKAR